MDEKQMAHEKWLMQHRKNIDQKGKTLKQRREERKNMKKWSFNDELITSETGDSASDCCLNVNMSNGYVNLFSDASTVYVYTVGAESHMSYVCAAATGTLSSSVAASPRRVLNVGISRLVVFQSTRIRHHHQHQRNQQQQQFVSSPFAANNNLMRANKSVIDQINQMNLINSVLERRRGAGAYFSHFWGTLLRVDSVKCSHSRLTRLTVHSLFVELEHLPHHYHHHSQLAQLVPAALGWLVRIRQRFDALSQPCRVN